jgi:tetratricopeptide (TPR) repeat protein
MKLQTIIMMSLVLFGTGALACAADQQTAFDQANTAFAQKNYGRAASDFQAIIARQGYSAPVLFNLANAYYNDGQIGLAILNYQRAQLLAPGDADIAFNLHFARANAGLADRPTMWFDQAARFFSLNALSWLAGAAVLFIATGIVVRQFTRRNRFGWRAVMIASVCVLLATISAVGIRWPELSQAIVTEKNTPVYISPITIGQPLYTLAEGQTITLCKAYGEFMLVETSDGHRGWVKCADVSPLIATKLEKQIASG